LGEGGIIRRNRPSAVKRYCLVKKYKPFIFQAGTPAQRLAAVVR